MNTGGQRILIIESNTGDSLLLEIMLIKVGVIKSHITTIEHVEDLRKLPGLSFDFIFLEDSKDVGVMRGILSELQEKLNHPIVIAMMQDDEFSAAAEILNLGVSDYLVKDAYDAKDLHKAMLLSWGKREVQNELERSEARFRGLIEQGFDGIIIADENQVISYASPSVRSITGYTPKELIGKTHLDLIVEEDRQTNREPTVRLTSGDLTSITIKERFRTKSGEPRWIETRISDCRSIRGLNGFLINFRDIHEAEKANEARRHAEEKNNILIESTSDGVWQWNLQSNSVFWSDSIYKMLGYEFNGDLEEQNIKDLTHPDDRVNLRNDLMERVQQNRPYHTEFRIRNAEGTYLWVRAEGSGLRDEKGELFLIIGTLRNIHRRKLMELALDENRALLKSLTDNVRGCVARHCTDRYGNVKVLFINRGAEEVFDHPIERIIENPELIWNAISGEDRDKIQESFQKSTRNMSGYDVTFAYKSPNGRRKNLHTRATLTPAEDDGILIDSITMDITPLKKVEAELNQGKKLLNSIMDNVDGAVQRYRLNPDGTFDMLYFSKGHEKITGLSMESLIKDPSPIWSQVVEEDHRKISELVQKTAKTLEPWSYVWQIQDANGTTKWIRGQGIPHRCEDGSVEWDQVLTDITSIQETENELRRAKDRFELAAKAAGLGVWEYDINNDTVKWDPSMMELFGVDPDCFKGKYEDWTSCVHPEDRERVMSEVDEVLQSESGRYSTQYRIFDGRTGEIKYIQGTGRVLPPENGRGPQLVGLNWDVTHMEVARRKLADSNRRYELAAKATSDAVWDWNLLTGYLEWSPGLETYFGHRLEDSRGKLDFWENLIHPDERVAVVDGLKRFMESTNSEWEDGYRMKRADGSYAEVVDRGFLVRDETGKPIRMVGAIRDVTEHVEFDRALKEQNRKLRQIAWTQSHELRGPLSRILGLIDLIEKGGADGIENQEILDYLKRSANELDEVIHHIVRLTERVDLSERKKPSSSGLASHPRESQD